MISWLEAQKKISQWLAAGCALDNTAIAWAGQGGPRPKLDDGTPHDVWVSVNLIATNSVGTDEENITESPLVLVDQVIVEVVPADDTLEVTAHLFTSGDGPVLLETTDTLPAGTDDATEYWVVVIDEDTVKLAASRADAVAETPSVFVDITDEGIGTHKIVTIDGTRRPLEDVQRTLSGHRVGTLSVQCFSTNAVGALRAQGVLERLRASRLLWSQQELLRGVGVAAASMSSATLVGGSASSAAKLEPRAVVTVSLNYVDGVTELLTYIESVEGTVEFDDVAGDSLGEVPFSIEPAV